MTLDSRIPTCNDPQPDIGTVPVLASLHLVTSPSLPDDSWS
jgi:hypothetical protein